MSGYYEGECPSCNRQVELEGPDDDTCPYCDAEGCWFEDYNETDWWMYFEWDYNI